MGNEQSNTVVVDELQLKHFRKVVVGTVASIEPLRGPAENYGLADQFGACDKQRGRLLRTVQGLMGKIAGGLQSSYEEAVENVHIVEIRRAIENHMGDMTLPPDQRLRQLQLDREKVSNLCTQYNQSLQQLQAALDEACGPQPNRKKKRSSVGVLIAGQLGVRGPAGCHEHRGKDDTTTVTPLQFHVIGGEEVPVAKYMPFSRVKPEMPRPLLDDASMAVICNHEVRDNTTVAGLACNPGTEMLTADDAGIVTRKTRAQNRAVIKMLKDYVADCNAILKHLIQQSGAFTLSEKSDT